MRWLSSILALSVLLPSLPSSANPQDREKILAERHGVNRDKWYADHYKKNMSGWRGVVFTCYYDESDITLEQICRRAVSDAEFLAAVSKIKLVVAKNNDAGEASYISTLGRYLTLEYTLTATRTEGNNSVKAVHAELSFKTFYSNAVEKDAKSGSMGSMPRSGRLVVWSRSAIGSGDSSDIVTPFSDSAESIIKDALTFYLKNSTSSEKKP